MTVQVELLTQTEKDFESGQGRWADYIVVQVANRFGVSVEGVKP